jgi:hypothetical protein
MAQITTVAPSGPVTLTPGQTQDFTVSVSGVPADGTATVGFTASDGTAGNITIQLDRPGLEALVGASTPQVHQVIGQVTGGGTLAVVGVSGNTATFRYTAPTS